MRSRWKSIVLTAAKFSIPAVIIGFLVWRIEPEQWETLASQPKNYGLLFAALLVAIAATSLSFSRWCLLVRCQRIELSLVEAFRLGSIGFLLSFVSAGSVGGDLFKAIFLAQRRPGKRIEAVASVLVDRGSGLYGLLLLVTIALLMSGSAPTDAANVPAASQAQVGIAAPITNMIDMDRIKWATTFLVGTGTVVLVILILGGKSVDRMIRWGSTLPVIGSLVEKIGRPLRMFHMHPVGFLVSILMSLGVQSLLVVSFYLVARGLYSNPPTFAEHFVIVPIGMLASALPVTPAGVGVLELAMDAYRVVPATKTNASGTLVALVFEMVRVALAALATLFYWTADAEVRHSLEIAEEETHAEAAPST